MLVPLAWGTYNPSLRLLYSLPHPPSPGELSGTRLCVALLPFLPPLLALARGAAQQRRDQALPALGSQDASAGATDWALVLRASMELGGYNLLGTVGQAWGLEHTSAVHAAVLLSSINVFVPLGAALSGELVRPATWVACVLVLAAIALLNSGGGVGQLTSGDGALTLVLSPGDAAVLCAALSYSTYTVRLGAFARRLPALPLSAGKTAVLALGCCAYAVAERGLGHAHPLETGSVLWGGEGASLELRSIAWATLLFSALVPGSLATWLQARGQSGVSAPEAQVILALTPVVSVCVAGALLGETVGANVFEAGAIMLTASAICIASDIRAGKQKTT